VKRTVIIYVVLLLVALVFAYNTWTHEDEADLSEATVVLAGDPEDLEGIDYSSDKLNVSLDVRKDELGSYVWVRVVPQETPDAEETKEDEPENPHAPPEDDGEIVEFKAGNAGDDLVDGMAPFVVKRQLEGVSDDKLDELGLATPEAHLTIRRAGREPKSYELGGNRYGGTNFYLRDPDDGKIYLVDGKLIRPLQSAKRTLPDRTLVGVPNNELVKLTVQAGEASATFVQHNQDDAEANFWATEGSEDKNPEAGGFIDKALNMRSSQYVVEGEEPTGLEEAFTFTVVTTDKKQIGVNVYRAWGADGEESWYARSAHTRALVTLHRSAAADVTADLPTVLDSGV
jgi:hypothetical protein